jgi:hypothetical protein
MSDWHEHRLYCPYHQGWVPTNHALCSGSRFFVDLNNPTYLRCNKCPYTCAIDSNFNCREHGATVKQVYATSRLVMQVGDRIIRTDGNVVYVMQRTGMIVVARRQLITSSYV